MAAIQDAVQRDDEIDLSELLGTLSDHKWLIGTITGIFILLSIAYALLTTPIYQATSVVQVEQKVPSLPGLSALTQTLGASSPEATTETALITSRMVIGAAVDELKLTIEAHPQRMPVIGNFFARRYASKNPGLVSPPLFDMIGYDWGGSKLEIFQLDVPDSLLDRPLRLVAGKDGAYVLVDDDDNVLVVGNTGQAARGHGVTIQVQTLVANPGTQFRVFRHRRLTVINGLQQAINVNEQGKESGILRMTYDNPNPELATNVLKEVGELYVRQDVDRNSAEAANSLKFVREQLPNVRRDLERATAALNAYQIKAHSVDISMQTQGLLDQEVAIQANIQKLRLQQADMQRQYTPEHPAYKALIQQIGQLEAQKSGIDKKVGNLPDTQQQLLKLTRDVQVSNDTYTGLLNQAQQLDIARAGTVGNVRIIDKAAVDITRPVWPRRMIVVLGGALLGGFVALVYVFIRQMLNRGIEDPAVIEKIGLPVYATIPISLREQALQGKRIHGRGKQHLLVMDAPTDLATEALRSLRTSLHFARLEAKNNVLMISGSSPDVGKTFVSANLATVVAQSNQRVLLVDGDMRMGSLHKVVGGKPEVGLSELISGQTDLITATRQIGLLENLHFIARGKLPPNPSELLMNARFSALLEHLKQMFDLIIIDTPPILAVTDAAIIGHHAGTALLVVRFGLNQAREVALARQRFEQNNVPLKGAIFNAVEKRSRGYYSYAYYGVGAPSG
ncbi:MULTISPECIES: polysaccharide biosynthesis tyrosine autokinase [unclassified Rhodanobacter]|uniref:polysaccharide biosynthesis tyrosine autokinase n=1 Tax=unclassified Rhodanobacter TaxID=2621553 RepID=UPI001BE05E3F|nr:MULTISPECIES: polysaccharide biosynthesis tyrosine autokinase [unclassified Rhodanobacter]MBT2145168.1 polysaccharide biosynthesis tyrosine autokinase [Rhodanobacter sp. LX-99]MBT2149213.1 polysaccharide biosynthesis tyrosine autokinase [Rhodanobacter sp. LX-100]